MLQRWRHHLSAVPAVVLLVIALSGAPAFAQDTGGSAVGARLVPGIAFQVGRFGDDNPRTHSETGLTLGAQMCMNRSADRAVVAEATMPFNWLDNPHGEWVRAVPVLVAYQRGRDTYFRAGIGVVVEFWKSARGRRTVEVGLAGSVAVGRNFGSQRAVATEGVLQIMASPGFFGLSLGAGVPVGKCTR